MLLVDTSIWVDGLRNKDALMADRLTVGDVVMHDYVLGEIVLGGVSQAVLANLLRIRRCRRARHEEVLSFIAERKLAGRGLGYVDCHLLAAALINGLQLWTRDKALQQAAKECGCGFAMH